MAKDVFQRTKPHVNVATTLQLQRLGLSASGLDEFLQGQVVNSPADRQILAELLASLLTHRA